MPATVRGLMMIILRFALSSKLSLDASSSQDFYLVPNWLLNSGHRRLSLRILL